MKTKIGFIYGGRSTEHDASLKSFDNMNSMLDYEKYDVEVVFYVDREGKIFYNNKEIKFHEFIKIWNEHRNVFMINLLHGQEGEDGSWSGLADIIDAYGSFETVYTSSILMDKYSQGCIVNERNICIDGVTVKSPKTIQKSKKGFVPVTKIELSSMGSEYVIVKPNSMGASHFMGRFAIDDISAINSLIQKIFEYDDKALIQECISGVEYTCGVINDYGNTRVLKAIQVGNPYGVWSFEEKHKHGSNKYDFSENKNTEMVKLFSKEMFELFSVIGWCRFDFMVAPQGIYFLEGNLIPGFSDGSMFPMMLKDADISFSEFVNMLIWSYSNKNTRSKYLPYTIE